MNGNVRIVLRSYRYDTASPTAVCQDITVYLDGAGNASSGAMWMEAVLITAVSSTSAVQFHPLLQQNIDRTR